MHIIISLCLNNFGVHGIYLRGVLKFSHADSTTKKLGLQQTLHKCRVEIGHTDGCFIVHLKHQGNRVQQWTNYRSIATVTLHI